MLYPRNTGTRETTSLDGLWRLVYDPRHVGLRKGYPRRMPAGTEEVAVPASINEQVTGSAKYNHMDWVWYFRKFRAPRSWRGRRVFLRFGSVNYRAEVFLNGRRLGAHEGGYMPFEFEPGAALDFDGENFLAVRVDNLLDNCTVPQGDLDPSIGGVTAWRRDNYPNVHYDFFPFTGIHRPVTLYSTGESRLEKVFLETLRLAGGAARVRLRGSFSGNARELRVAIPGLGFEKRFALKGRSGKFEFPLSLKRVKAWSPRSPKLYEVSFALLDRDGVELDDYALDFGFRTVKIRGAKILLNGREVFLRGFGRHEDTAVSGKGLNLPYLVKDYNLMEWIGANSFRTSHYPYSEEDMQLADRRGVLVIDESAANTLSMLAARGADRQKLTATHRGQVTELIERDFNHPAVIAWSLGNECETYRPESRGYFRKMVAFARKLDSSQPVTFVVNSSADLEREADSFDIICVNLYPAWYQRCGRLEEVVPLTRERVDGFWKKYRKPILISEFGADAVSGLHSEYDLMWSEEFQADMVRQICELAEKHPRVCGAHIWNLADFKVGQHTGRIILNRKGVFTRDRTPKLVAHTVRKLWRPDGG